MITKERLEELIEQGKFIYSTDTKLYGCVRMLELENQLEKVEYDKNGKVKLFITDNGWWHWFSLKDLYESKEDVEEILEFGDITRTERLELPTFDELFDEIFAGSFGIHTIQRFDNVQIRYKLLLSGVAWLFVVKGKDELFTAPLSRENYNEARRLCVKLFKGEE